MATNPFRRRRSLQRNQHGPAAQLGASAQTFPGWVRGFHAIIRREQAETVAKLRADFEAEIGDLKRQLREEKDVRRSRHGGLVNTLREERADLAELRYRVTRIEGGLIPPSPDGGPDGDPVDAVPAVVGAKLHLVPKQGTRENAAA